MSAAMPGPARDGTDASPVPAQHGAQYRRFWRWHLYAALLVVPFVLWQGVSGVLYLWHAQIADAMWPELRFVAPGAERVDLDTMLRAAAADSGATPKTVRVFAEPERSVQFVFGTPDGLSRAVFVDPYRGTRLGEVPASTWLPGLTRSLHGGWPLGRAGSWLLELGACWAIVMVLTGFYLWWPRGRPGLAGTAYPRLRAGGRVFWRDLHAVAGVWSGAIVLAFLLTALPWTDAWGGWVLRPIQSALGQRSPDALGFGHAVHRAAHGPASPLGLQPALALAAAEGLHGELELRIGRGDGPITLTAVAPRASDERVLSIARDGSRVLDRADWGDFPPIPKVVAIGVDLHEGTYFGTAGRVFNTLMVAALFWIVATGAIGWYRRRPGRGLGAPAATGGAWPRGLVALAVALCLLLPLFGLSVLAVAATERLVAVASGRRWRTG